MKRKSFISIRTCLTLIVFLITFRFALGQSDIVAIDILLNPDQTMLDTSTVYNGMMQQNYIGPGSFSLDELHNPHITVLQCFVRSTDLERIYAVVAEVVRREKPTKEKLTAKGFYYFPYNGLGLAGITIDTTPALLHFQSQIIAAIKPFIIVGTNAAFVQNTDGSPIALASSEYVNGFIPDHSGTKYNPHVTIGLAQEAYLKELLVKPFNKFTFKNSSVAIYHLGDFGTARRLLWTSKKQ